MRNFFSAIVVIALLSLTVSCGKFGKHGGASSKGQTTAKAPVHGGDSVANLNQLPDVAQDYIKKRLSDKDIARVGSDNDEIKVWLTTGEILEFDLDGKIKKIECPGGVPESIVEERILQDVKSIDPKASIVKIEVENDGDYEVKLDTGKEVTYDANCKRIGIDE